MSGSTIGLNSKIAIGFVLALIGAAVSFGVQMQKINDLSDRVVRIENKIDRVLESRGLTVR